MANFDDWVPHLGLVRCHRHPDGRYTAVASYRPSCSGKRLEQRSCNLGIHRNGIVDFPVGKKMTPIDLVMAALGLSASDAFSWLDDKLGWSAGCPEIEIAPEPSAGPREAEGPAGDEKTGVPPEAPATDALELLTYGLPGLLGEITEWALATAYRPNRVVAMAAGIMTISALISRRVAIGRSGAHLYLIVVGATSIGKQHVLDCVDKLLSAAGAGAHIGAEMSAQSGVENILERSAASVCLIDEFAVFLRRILSPKASGWEAGAGKNLLSLWGTNFNNWRSVEWSQRPSKTIYAPALSVLGCTTPEKFAAVLQGESARDGLVSRMLVVRASVRQELTDDVTPGLLSVPVGLAERVKALYEWTGPESLLQVGNGSVEIVPKSIPMDKGAKESIRSFREEIDRHVERNRGDQPYLDRCAEQALRLSMIRAVGRQGHMASVSVEDMDWAIAVSRVCGIALADAIQETVQPNRRVEHAARVLRIASKFHPERLTFKRILDTFNNSVNTRELMDILSQEVERGHLVEHRIPGKMRPNYEITPDGLRAHLL
jgi:hypothetical protein